MRQSVPEAGRSRIGQVASLTGQSLGGGELAGRHAAELVARGDVELQEDLAQVVLHRTGADEQLRADLRVRETISGEPSDLRLLGCEDVEGVHSPSERSLPGSQELATGALGERPGPEATEQLVCGAQLITRIHPATLSPEPFAVEQMRAGELDADPGALEPLDRLAVQSVRDLALAHQGA